MLNNKINKKNENEITIYIKFIKFYDQWCIKILTRKNFGVPDREKVIEYTDRSVLNGSKSVKITTFITFTKASNIFANRIACAKVPIYIPYIAAYFSVRAFSSGAHNKALKKPVSLVSTQNCNYILICIFTIINYLTFVYY